MKKRKIIATVVALAVAFVAWTTVEASAKPADTSGRAALKSASHSMDRYSDREILQLLLAAQGPVARDHPRLKRVLGFNEAKPRTNERALNQVITSYLRYNPNFHAETAKPLQSGDPQRVDAGLRTFSISFNKFALARNKALKAQAQNGEFDAQARGWFWMGAYVAIYATAVAVANAGVYANAAVATNALATLVIVTWYLEDGTPAANTFEHDHLIKSLTDALG